MTGDVAYRCVCGRSVKAAAGQDVRCDHCGRRVSAGLLESLAATVVLAEQGPSPELSVAPPNDAFVHQRLGHFRVLDLIGRGGMGAVYRALDESLQRFVALKVIRSATLAPLDSKHVQRLLEEAVAQARVNHPNVAHIYFVGREGEAPFLAMELLAGPTLAERLSAAPLAFAEVVRLAMQLVAGLNRCSQFDILHGDIKPSNILFADDLTVKLSDFGLARRISAADAAASITGTPTYMSPEGARGELTDVRSDIYSLGMTIFEMTFRRLPYALDGSDINQVLETHQRAPVEFPDPWPADVPIGWRNVLARLLAKSPAERYQNYGELLHDLRRWRPVDLPQAGRLPRGLAWLIDLGLANTAQQIFYGPLVAEASSELLSSRPGVRLVLASLGASVPLLAGYLQYRWGTTPGKKLFHIRIVDRHGLPPSKPVLGLRAAIQFLPMWTATVVLILGSLGLGLVSGLVVLAAALGLLTEISLALFHPRGRTLHDRFFGTRVVLGAAPQLSRDEVAS